MLSSCGWHLGFTDIPYLHSKTFLSPSFLEIRHPSVRSLQQWNWPLPVPIIWHIVHKKQFLARGNSPNVVSQDPAQLRAKVPWAVRKPKWSSRNESCTGAGPLERQRVQQLTQTGDTNYTWPARKNSLTSNFQSNLKTTILPKQNASSYLFNNGM